MPVILFSKVSFSGKDGRKWVKYTAINSKGEEVAMFFSAEQAEALAIPDAVVVKPAQLEQLFKELPIVDVQFNQRGRVESVDVGE